MFGKIKDLLLDMSTNNDWNYDRAGNKVYKRAIRWRYVLVALASLWLICAMVYLAGWVFAHVPLKTILDFGALELTILSAAVVCAAVAGDIQGVREVS